jgi:pentatricopeptide repeat protein
MSKAGLEPDSSTTRPLYLYLSSSPELYPKAWSVLQELHDSGHHIPVAAANVVIESCIAANLLAEAINLYKSLHTFISSGPNTETFNVLLQGCSRQRSKDTAMFLASEMAALGIKPDQLTYDRLILVCLHEEDYEDAFLYLEEMKAVASLKGENGWWLRNGTAIALVRRCLTEDDDRCWGLLGEMEKRGMVDERFRTWMERNWKGEGQPFNELERQELSGEDKLKEWATF